jgi:hypothetical protein
MTEPPPKEGLHHRGSERICVWHERIH